jgi:cation:H+ antiporter
MIASIACLSVSLLLILAACYVFVNAIECLGKVFNFHQGIIGSIFAAIGTALPETMIPIIAILFTKSQNAHDVGIGAIAGAPFMLGTLGFFVTGSAVFIYRMLGKRDKSFSVDSKIISKDLTFFLIIYGIAIATTFFHEIIWLKIAVALLLLVSYGVYLKLIVSSDSDQLENVEDLYLKKMFKLPENIFWISFQISIALVVIVLGANIFIRYVQTIALSVGISPLILSLIITPIATELPEKLNSIIWIGRGKETLALGNITGAMVFQSCFPVVFGMICTPWHLEGMTLVSAGLALVSAFLILLWIKLFKKIAPVMLLTGGIMYAVFICALFFVK